ncbi:MAG: 2-amino-4-hydroxy-6-hydroxymethyldihydropteridine diphosphokinase [bacterium]|nr:2-amino-4-hydroxy-6-hydroxymethyldihydropteridine diphosphokinase [bacterium]
MITAWIGLGSNAGDRMLFMSRAVEGLSSLETTRVTDLSSLYETAPVEVGGGLFINAVARIETALTAGELLKAVLRLEKELGRERTPGKAEPRVMDLDLLLFGDERMEEPDLILPHPRMTGRRFVMVPLAELEGSLPIPGTGRTAAQIAAGLERSAREQAVKRLGTLEALTSGKPVLGLDQPSPKKL